MANGIIESQEELSEYLTNNPAREALSTVEIAFIVNSARFDSSGRFRGMRIRPINEKFTAEEVRALLIALNNPPTVYNFYPGGPNAECIAEDDAWCTDYFTTRPHWRR